MGVLFGNLLHALNGTLGSFVGHVDNEDFVARSSGRVSNPGPHQSGPKHADPFDRRWLVDDTLTRLLPSDIECLQTVQSGWGTPHPTPLLRLEANSSIN